MIDVYLKLLEQGFYEAKFAFEGSADGNVWKRPAEGRNRRKGCVILIRIEKNCISTCVQAQTTTVEDYC